MPELPEVETVRLGLAPVLVGATLIAVEQRRPDLRFPFPENFAGRLAGRRVEALERRAKYLAARLDDGAVLVMHLGMSGSFRIENGPVGGDNSEAELPGIFHHPRSTRASHDHVVFTLSNSLRVVYNDPRRFGFMRLLSGAAPGADPMLADPVLADPMFIDPMSIDPMFAGLGVEPLGDGFDGATLARLFAGRSTPLKAALLDQSLVAGLGNIYVCEALHRAGLSPRRAAGTLARRDGAPTARADRLAAVIRDVLLEAVAAGGSSLRDHRQTDGTRGAFQLGFRVYDRLDHPCPSLRCSGVVGRIVQNGRSTFFCATCQR